MDILADTNVILRGVQPAHPQHRTARAALRKLAGQGNRVCVASQNLIEFWVVCTRPVASNGLGLTPDRAQRVLASIEAAFVRLQDSDAVYFEWQRLVTVLGVSGKQAHDARLVAAMNVSSMHHILTFDTADFTRYPGLTVLDPRTL